MTGVQTCALPILETNGVNGRTTRLLFVFGASTRYTHAKEPNMNRNWCAVLILPLLTIAITTSAFAQVRVVNYNIAKLNGNQNAIAEVLQAASDDDSLGFATPVSIFLFQEVDASELAILQTAVGPNYSMATFTDQNDSSWGGAQAMFFLATQFDEDVASHVDIFTQASRHADRWRLDVLGYDSASRYV